MSEVGRRSVGVVQPAGRVPYGAGLEWQRRLANARRGGRLGRDLLLLLEHEPVLTVGRGASSPLGAEAAGGGAGGPEVGPAVGPRIPRFEIERGGDATYHGPGQLVGYSILDLRSYRKDLHWYVRRLEEALILALGDLAVSAFRLKGYTGVWVGEGSDVDASGGLVGSSSANLAGRVPRPLRIVSGSLRKIASIGVHVSRWVTWHGFALNVTDEPLEPFRQIVPCGIEGVRMTSLESEGVAAGWPAVLGAVGHGFGRAFGASVAELPMEELDEIGLGLAGAAATAAVPATPAAGAVEPER